MTYHRLKPKLVRGVHYVPIWGDDACVVAPPSSKKVEQGAVYRERKARQKRVYLRLPAITDAIKEAFGITHSKAITIAILVEARGEICSHDELGQTINQANSSIANARLVLGKDAVINHVGRGYTLSPEARQMIMQRAGLSDD